MGIMSSYSTDLAGIAKHLEKSETLEAIEVWLGSYHHISAAQFLAQIPKDWTVDILKDIDEKLQVLNSARDLITLHLNGLPLKD